MNTAIDLKPRERFEGVPKGYTCTSKGVVQLGDDDKHTTITTRPIVVRAESHDNDSRNWGVQLWWLDKKGREHERIIPKRLFHAAPAELAQVLADEGLPIAPGAERKLLVYLNLFNAKQWLIAADRTGWLNGAFVMPLETLREPEGERIVYQPAQLSNHTRVMRRKGSLEQWQDGIKDVSPLIQFLVCASLSAPVRYLCDVESGGFHIWGETSHGKSTALQVAASCWGNGADPQKFGGGECYINRWNATDNALEAKCEMHNDLPMIVDEIGENDSKAFGSTIYKIFSGTGRDRSQVCGGLRDSKSWRVSVLSAGEIAVADFIQQGGGKVKGGQLVRLIDIDVAKAPPITRDAEESNTLKQHCADHYGMAGPELLERVSDLTEGWKELDYLLLGPADTPLAHRARQRFALVWHTGLIAIKAGVLPWQEADILDAVRIAYGIWLEQISTVSDEHRGIVNVMNFILANESRFETGNEQHPVRDRVGWIRDGRYCFSLAGFKEACAGVNEGQTKQALNDANLLHRTANLTARIRVNGQTTNVVAVKAEILSWGADSTSSTSSASSTPATTRDVAATAPQGQAVAPVAQTVNQDTPATAATGVHTQAVAPESPAVTGVLPPLLPLPPENDQPIKYREGF
ncbi:DUF927 domain-containing protein [Marinobacterium weihaiense]|uniref:DUF927 domain-containing protein n=1 Tax=Marinobacterium weihaiense TaxID=2851016 RepID=A0ABS6M6X5_9GAMM|nr:DUF927 domain-containing protein [Marinobacterium weihaiense]MBV0932031.1 DUF927 domain-containing protein [Marinobacterium weihaiense]